MKWSCVSKRDVVFRRKRDGDRVQRHPTLKDVDDTMSMTIRDEDSPRAKRDARKAFGRDRYPQFAKRLKGASNRAEPVSLR
jgi:hypothetical protein